MKFALVIQDDDKVFLRAILSTTAPLSGRGEGTYTVKPIKWTPKRRAMIRKVLQRIAKGAQ